MASAVREALREVKQQGGGTHLMGERGFMDTGTPRQALKIRRWWLGGQAQWGVTGVGVLEESENVWGVF